MTDWTKPLLTDAYAGVLSELMGRDIDAATMFVGSSSTNIPNGAIRWNSTNYQFEIYAASGGTWSSLTGQMNINVVLLGADPTLALQAATKQYVDNLVGPLVTAPHGFSNLQAFIASGTWTCPASITRIFAQAWGGGGGGGGGLSGYDAAGGGAGGDYAEGFFTVTPGDTYAVTIGGPGGGASGNTSNNGNQGGQTKLTDGSTTLIYASGGGGGGGAAVNGVGNGGNPTGVTGGGQSAASGSGGGGGTNQSGTSFFIGGFGGSAPFGASVTPGNFGQGNQGFGPGGGGSGGANGGGGGGGGGGELKIWM